MHLVEDDERRQVGHEADRIGSRCRPGSHVVERDVLVSRTIGRETRKPARSSDVPCFAERLRKRGLAALARTRDEHRR